MYSESGSNSTFDFSPIKNKPNNFAVQNNLRVKIPLLNLDNSVHKSEPFSGPPTKSKRKITDPESEASSKRREFADDNLNVNTGNSSERTQNIEISYSPRNSLSTDNAVNIANFQDSPENEFKSTFSDKKAMELNNSVETDYYDCASFTEKYSDVSINLLDSKYSSLEYSSMIEPEYSKSSIDTLNPYYSENSSGSVFDDLIVKKLNAALYKWVVSNNVDSLNKEKLLSPSSFSSCEIVKESSKSKSTLGSLNLSTLKFGVEKITKLPKVNVTSKTQPICPKLPNLKTKSQCFESDIYNYPVSSFNHNKHKIKNNNYKMTSDNHPVKSSISDICISSPKSVLCRRNSIAESTSTNSARYRGKYDSIQEHDFKQMPKYNFSHKPYNKNLIYNKKQSLKNFDTVNRSITKDIAPNNPSDFTNSKEPTKSYSHKNIPKNKFSLDTFSHLINPLVHNKVNNNFSSPVLNKSFKHKQISSTKCKVISKGILYKDLNPISTQTTEKFTLNKLPLSKPIKIPLDLSKLETKPKLSRNSSLASPNHEKNSKHSCDRKHRNEKTANKTDLFGVCIHDKNKLSGINRFKNHCHFVAERCFEYVEKLQDSDCISESENSYNSLCEWSESKSKLLKYRNCCSEIFDASRIYISGSNVASNIKSLHQNKITHIINMAGDVCLNYFPNDFYYATFILQDSREYISELQSILPNILLYMLYVLSDNNINRVLIHCCEGVSRSSTVALAYLIWIARIKFQDAFDIVRSARATCNPNTGFTFVLLKLEKQLSINQSYNHPICDDLNKSVFISPKCGIKDKLYDLFDLRINTNKAPPLCLSSFAKIYLSKTQCQDDTNKVSGDFENSLLRISIHDKKATFLVAVPVATFNSRKNEWMPSDITLDPRFFYILRNNKQYFLWEGSQAVHSEIILKFFFYDFIVQMCFFDTRGNYEWEFYKFAENSESEAFWKILYPSNEKPKIVVSVRPEYSEHYEIMLSNTIYSFWDYIDRLHLHQNVNFNPDDQNTQLNSDRSSVSNL